MKRAPWPLVAALWSTRAFAQEPRPPETEIFGPESPAAESAERETEIQSTSTNDRQAESKIVDASQDSVTDDGAPAPSAEDERDGRALGRLDAPPQLSPDVAPADPLTIGGQVYLRSLSSARQGDAPTDWSFSTPTLVDAYFDARPNDRVRAFVLGRVFYDPTLADSAIGRQISGQVAGTGSVQGSPSLSMQMPTRGPSVILDQLWLRFDLGYRVFITAGKQHVRWGTARVWMPGDFLHIRRRNPLDVFDARPGTTMVKFHLPVEDRGWNFYAYVITESVTTTSNLGAIAGAARGEFVLGPAEVGLGALVQGNQESKFQADISTGFGALDVYAEVALRQGSEIDRVRFNPNATIPPPPERQPWQSEAEWGQGYLRSTVDALYPATQRRGMKAQAVGGFTYQCQYADRDVFLVGAEYFYNPLGYNDPNAYLGLVLPRSQPLVDPATFFYLGRHYGALFASLPAPFNWDLHSFAASTLANISDQTFISRLDYSYTLLTHVRLEAFASVRYGQRAGEFRFGVTAPEIMGQPSVSFQPTAFDFGFALRVSI